MKLLQDFKTVLDYKLRGEATIEEVNDILLSDEYYGRYGEYGVDNFLYFFSIEVKNVLREQIKPTMRISFN